MIAADSEIGFEPDDVAYLDQAYGPAAVCALQSSTTWRTSSALLTAPGRALHHLRCAPWCATPTPWRKCQADEQTGGDENAVATSA